MKPPIYLLPVLFLYAGCRPPAPPLPEYGAVPDFELTDQAGRSFTGRAMAGKVWVADFMFTSCMGPCPRMSSRLHQVQESTAKLPGVELVSFTIDPRTDTPAVLKEYAKAHGASDRWFFLTGAQPTLHNLCRNVFKLGDVDGSLTHSTKFILIDRNRQIRGYYDSYDPDSLSQLESDVRAVARERT